MAVRSQWRRVLLHPQLHTRLPRHQRDRISVSLRAGLRCGTVTPSGVIMSFRPPRRCRRIGMRMVSVSISGGTQPQVHSLLFSTPRRVRLGAALFRQCRRGSTRRPSEPGCRVEAIAVRLTSPDASVPLAKAPHMLRWRAPSRSPGPAGSGRRAPLRRADDAADPKCR